MKKVGIDLGKRQSECCVFDEGGAIVERFQVRTSREGLSGRFSNRERCLIGVESSRDSGWIQEHLTSLGHEVMVLDTTRSRAIGIGARRRKTDRRDAEAIGRALISGLAKPAHVLSAQRRQLRDALWGRDKLVGMRTRLVAMVRGQFRGRGVDTPQCAPEYFPRRMRESELPGIEDPVVGALLRVLDEVQVELEVVESHLEKLSEREEAFERLCSAPAVGLITSLAVVAAWDDATRFADAHAVEGYLGFGTSEYSTGGKRRTGRITKCGNPMARRMLVQAANNLLKTRSAQSDPLVVWAKQVWERRGRKKAVVALARRLAGVLWAMTVDGTFYDPHGLARASWQGLSRRARHAQAAARTMRTTSEALTAP